MIAAIMYVALGFCTAGLIALAILPAFYRRAARLTEEALRAVNPSSYAEVRAAQDQERAHHALSLRRVERKLEGEREKSIKGQLETSRLQAELDALKKRHAKEIEALTAISAEEEHKKASAAMTAEIEILKEKLADAETAAEANAALSETAGETTATTRALMGGDTVALATITGLEAQVATLKSKLSAYESGSAQSGEDLQPEIDENNAKAIVADLEAQLVDAEAKFITAQAEVTRLSVQLDLAGLEETEVLEQARRDLKLSQAEKAQASALLRDKDRTLTRTRRQLHKVKSDLARAPELLQLRKDLETLTAKVSESLGTGREDATAKEDTSVPEAPAKPAKAISAAGKGSGDPASALVNRVVKSGRVRGGSTAGDVTGTQPAGVQDPKQKKVDVA